MGGDHQCANNQLEQEVIEFRISEQQMKAEHQSVSAELELQVAELSISEQQVSAEHQSAYAELELHVVLQQHASLEIDQLKAEHSHSSTEIAELQTKLQEALQANETLSKEEATMQNRLQGDKNQNTEAFYEDSARRLWLDTLDALREKEEVERELSVCRDELSDALAKLAGIQA